MTCALLLWFSSVTLLSDRLLRQLEMTQPIPGGFSADVIVLLGGGLYPTAQDLSGTGVPSAEMMSRIVTAARLQRMTGLPLIVSGGTVFASEYPEATVVRRILIDLGLPADRIFVETSSRDTLENARFSKVICDRQYFRKVLLVTSAYHMKRALFLFDKAGLPALPVSAGICSGNPQPLGWQDLLPRASAMGDTAKVLREHIGMVFYRLTL
jgi:uncharacterized SAM-binding protein YcdF (DUF218 family)